MAHLVGGKRPPGDHLELNLLLAQLERLLRQAGKSVTPGLVSVPVGMMEQWVKWLEGALGE